MSRKRRLANVTAAAAAVATMGVLAFSPGAFFIDKIRANAPDGAVVAATANRDKVGPEAAVGDITLRQI